MKNTFLFLFIALGTYAFATIWDPPIDISPVGLGAGSPQIAVNGSPTGLAVWVETKGSKNVIQGAVFSSSGIWGVPANLSTLTNNSETPQVSINGSNNGIAIWVEHVGSDAIVMTSRFSGIGWETSVNLTSSGVASSPQIQINSSGNAVAVWVLNDGTNNVVQGAFYSSGSWSAPTTLSVGSASDSDEPQAALSDGNSALAVWSEVDESNNTIVRTRTYSGSWGSVVTLSELGANASFPQVSINDSDIGMAIWNYVGSNFLNVVQAASYTSGSWGTPVDVSDNTIEAYYPRLGLDSSGNAAAVWLQVTGILNDVVAATFFSGSWSTPEILSTSGEDSFSATAAMNENGQAIAVWISGSSITNVESSTFSSGSWDAPQILSTSGDHAFEPAVAVSENEAIVVWRDLSLTNYIIQASVGIME